MELEYKKLFNEVEKKFSKAKNITLATTDGVKISARTVCIINDGATLLVSTNIKSIKIAQIKANPNVAVAYKNLQAEATAELFGHPSAHPFYLKKFAKKYPVLARIYKPTDDDILVVIKPSKVRLYKYLGKPCEDVLDIENLKAFRR